MQSTDPISSVHRTIIDCLGNNRVRLHYTNYEGKQQDRFVRPLSIEIQSTGAVWHPGKLVLVAYDYEKAAERRFAVANIHAWEIMPTPPNAGKPLAKMDPKNYMKDLSQRTTRMSELTLLSWDGSHVRIPYCFPAECVLQRDPDGKLIVHEDAYSDDLLHTVGRICLSKRGLTEDEKDVIKLGITMALVTLERRNWLPGGHKYSEEESGRKLRWEYSLEQAGEDESTLEQFHTFCDDIEERQREIATDDHEKAISESK